MIPLRSALAMLAATTGLAAAVAGSGPAGATRLATEIAGERDHISAPELADRIMRGDPSLQVVDLRSPTEYAELHIAGARHAAIDALVSERPTPGTTTVLYSEGGAHAAQAWVLMRLRGHEHVYVLREGLYEWIARVLEPRLAVDATPAERTEFERAAERSRFFGGVPRADVPRSEVPVGYWTSGQEAVEAPAVATRQAIAGVRRRGC